MATVLYSKEFARFGRANYSLRAECDAKSEYYTCTLVKKHGDATIQSITLPFEILVKMIKRMQYAAEEIAEHRTQITMMPLDRNELFHALFKVSVVSQAERHWLISGLVRVEDRSVYIGMHDTGTLQEAACNAAPSMYLTLEALVLLENAVDELRALVDSHDIAAGGVRKHIGGVKVIKESFEDAVDAAFNI